ncbi:MAG: cardiolipin synthase [Clostridiales bacterium]|nr:MAG: cardiolipin synthase [Clostridiales bacterium]
MVLQVAIFVVMIVKFQDMFMFFYGASTIIGLIVTFYIVNEKSNPGYKIAWIIPVLVIPVFGTLAYILFGCSKLGSSSIRKMKIMGERIKKELNPDEQILEDIKKENITAYNQVHYLQKYAYSPAYKNAYLEYLPMGEVKFQRMKEELEKAERFIFLEYFIIEPGKMWNSILEILERKVKQGVEVRVIFDDLGCIKTLPYRYEKKLHKIGIKCVVFNKFLPILSSKLNNRDHRKICVIDGNVGITGGINLADEYINSYEKHGHWKDTSVLIKGSAVWNLTVMFLTMWLYITNGDEDFSQFKPTETYEENGIVQPYGDSPIDDELVGETVYRNMFTRANNYLYITTPYLIIDNEMVTALINVAKSGVDVRIITPHIADKWYVHAVTRAYYKQLIEGGVRIFEYTPGFIHAKTAVCDDLYATVGTINLDYRSLYLHFECGVFLYAVNIIADMKADFQKTLHKCDEVTLEQCNNTPLPKRLLRGFLRVFAPLM